jgi:hypothetical protein
MGLLSIQEEMEVNHYLAKEFIESHLNLSPNAENIEAIAALIFNLEHKAGSILR